MKYVEKSRRAAALWALISACSSAPEVSDTHAAPQVLDTGAFRHDQHLSLDLDGKLKCENCHSPKPEGKFAETLRPGSAQHAPCDGCHNEAFYRRPGELCFTCHVSVDILVKGNSPLKPFPRQNGRAQLIAKFDHRAHLERNKDRIKEGGEFVCEACHQIKDEQTAYATFPGHDTCGPCHAEVATPRITDCSGCHAEDGPTKGRHFLGNDVRFTHGKHRSGKDGKRIDCVTCHYAIPESTRASEIIMPQMKDCAECHARAELVPENVHIMRCGACHTSDVNKVELPGNHTASINPVLKARPRWASGGDSLPGAGEIKIKKELSLFPTWDLSNGLPSFLLPAATARSSTTATITATRESRGPRLPSKANTLDTVRPEDHTPLFRLRHARAASSNDAKCVFCHSGLSGSPVDNCRECHAVMKPENHLARWRSVSHGREAAKNPQRCATCHEIDYCTECHSLTPASHFPLEQFRQRHNRSARANPRSCMTCHSFESTCSKCHGTAISSGQVTTTPRNLRRH
jgi:hypothetical protein